MDMSGLRGLMRAHGDRTQPPDYIPEATIQGIPLMSAQQ